MNSISRSKTVMIITFTVMLLLQSISFAQTGRTTRIKGAHRALFDEKDEIELIIDELRRGIRRQRADKVFQRLSKDFAEPENGISSREMAKTYLEDAFTDAVNRPIQKSDTSFTSTWDFDITDVSIKVNKKTAHVECVLRFHLLIEDSPDSVIDLAKGPVNSKLAPPERGKRPTSKFTLVKKDNIWQLKNSGKLFGFVRSSMARFANENRRAQQVLPK